jgi:hypothetical protein
MGRATPEYCLVKRFDCILLLGSYKTYETWESSFKKVIAMLSFSYCKLDFEEEILEKLTELQKEAMQKVE